MRGEILGNRYRILSQVGDGGMASVYCAEDQTLQREVAVKILHPHLAKDKELTARFYQEASIAARLEHPNIMKIYDYGHHSDGRTYMVSELLRGQDLHRIQETRMKRTGTPFSPLFMAMVAEEILRGLAFAHSTHIVHRDIKPENVMVTEDGQIKLMDFGIAKNTALSVTTTGQFLGSPSYSSPEQIKGETVDARTDLYATGVLLFEGLTGRLPFTGKSAPEVMMKICQGNGTPLKAVMPSLHPKMESLVSKSIMVDKTKRFQSAEEMLASLRLYLKLCGVSSSRKSLEDYFANPEQFLKAHKQPQAEFKNETVVVSAGTLGLEAIQARPRMDTSDPLSAPNQRLRETWKEAPVAWKEAPVAWKEPQALAAEIKMQRARFAATARRKPLLPEPSRAPQPVRPNLRAHVHSMKRSRPVRQRKSGFFGWFAALSVILAFLGVSYILSRKPGVSPQPSAINRALEERPSRVVERNSPQASGRNSERSSDRNLDRNSERNADRRTERTTSQSSQAASERSPIKTPERNSEKPKDRPGNKSQTSNASNNRASEKKPDGASAGDSAKRIEERLVPLPKPSREEASTTTGMFSLQTVPGGVPVFLGSTSVGVTAEDGSTKTFSGSPGPQTLRIPNQTIRGTRFKGTSFRIFLEPGKTKDVGSIALTPLRTLSIRIQGPGVILRVNGDPYVQRNKALVLTLPEGEVRVEAKASNGKSLDRKVSLSGENMVFQASLE